MPIEQPIDTAALQDSSFSPELLKPFPPVEQWIKEHVQNNKTNLAFFLIFRVMELEINKGLSLYKAFLKLSPEKDTPRQQNFVFDSLIENTNAVSKHHDFFEELYYRIKNSSPKIPRAEIAGHLIITMQSIKNAFESSNARSIRTSDDKYGKEQDIPAEVYEQLDAIDAYYTQFVDLSKIAFPKEPPPLNNGNKEWHKKIKTALREIGKNKADKSSLVFRFACESALNAANSIVQKFFPNQTLEELILADPYLKELKERIAPASEVLHHYTIDELLPNEATDISSHSISKVGMVFQFKMNGQTHYWVNGNYYQLETLGNIYSNENHVAIEGNINGRGVVIIDSQTIEADLMSNRITEDGHLLIQTLERTNDPTQKKRRTFIDGEEVYLGVKYHALNMKVFGNRIIVIASDGSILRPFIFSSENINKVVILNIDSGSPIEIDGKLYFATGQKPNEKLYNYETSAFLDPLPDTLLKYGDFYSHPENSNHLGRANTIYSIFALPNGKYVAYNAGAQKLESRVFEVNFDNYVSRKQSKDQSTLLYQYQAPNGAKLTADEELHDFTHTFSVKEQFFNCLPDTTLKVTYNRENVLGFTIYVGDKQAYTGTTKLEGACLDYSGNIFAITQDDTGQYHYSRNHAILLSNSTIQFLGIHNGLPLVLSENASGYCKVYLGAEEIQYRFPGDRTFTKTDSSELESIPLIASVWTSGSTRVTEFRPNQKLNPGENALTQEDLAYLYKAEVIIKFQKLLDEKELLTEEFLALEAEGKLDENSRASISSRSKDIETNMKQLARYAQDWTEDTHKEDRQRYASFEGMEWFYKNLFEQNPEIFLNTFPSGLDTYSHALADTFLETFFPEIRASEKEEEKRIKRQALISKIGEFFTSIKGNPLNKRVQQKTTEKYQAANTKLRDATNSETAIKGGLGNESLLKSSKKLGELKNYSETGVHQVLCYQSSDMTWKSLPFTPTTGELLLDKKSTAYHLFPEPEVHSLRLQLLIQPDAELKTDSVEVFLNDGTKQQLVPFLSNNYYVVDVPPGTKKITYVDVKKEQQIAPVTWSTYSHFTKIFAEQHPEYYKGLSSTFPVDPHLLKQLEKFSQLSPLEAASNCEELCRNCGYYDTENEKTAEERSNLSHAQTLNFARERISQLKKDKKYKRGIKETHYYAGVCYESSLLLVAILRKLGFLAGIVNEYRLSANNSFSENQAHSSVFILWPTNTKGGYQPIYLDGTFTSSSNLNLLPRIAQSIREQLLNKFIKVENKDIHIDSDTLTENKYFESDDVEDPIATQSIPAENTHYSTPQEFVVHHETPTNYVEKLHELSTSQLHHMADLLIESLFAPPHPSFTDFREKMTTNERLAWLFKEFSAEEIQGYSRVPSSKTQLSTDKNTLITTILETITR